MPPSSAQVLRNHLVEKGVTPEIVRAAHLVDLYPKLHILPDGADFMLAEPLISGLPRGGAWGDQDFAVIVETRDIPQLHYVIRNVAAHTALPIQLFYGPENSAILDSPDIVAMRQAGKFMATYISGASLTAPVYNAMFLDPRFYDALAGRGKFLVFQTDSLCCEGSDFVLENFLAFDYVGALWNSNRPVGLRINGGFGGFSLRDYTACVDMLERFPPKELWRAGEDGYFAFHLDLTGHRVAAPHVMAQFGTQAGFQCKSFGAHQVRILPPQDHAQFLEYCPEIRNVLSWQR